MGNAPGQAKYTLLIRIQSPLDSGDRLVPERRAQRLLTNYQLDVISQRHDEKLAYPGIHAKLLDSRRVARYHHAGGSISDCA